MPCKDPECLATRAHKDRMYGMADSEARDVHHQFLGYSARVRGEDYDPPAAKGSAREISYTEGWRLAEKDLGASPEETDGLGPDYFRYRDEFEAALARSQEETARYEALVRKRDRQDRVVTWAIVVGIVGMMFLM